MELATKYKTLLSDNGIDTPLVLAHFFAQLEHESNLKPIAENLNYSSNGLRNIFGKYFNDLEAIFYARKPEKIANRVYANRMGNGDEASGEGWKYRGRGFIQITGKSNYTALANDTCIDCLVNPDLLLDEVNAMVSAVWFWNKNKINRFAHMDDLRAVTKRINGGLNGYDHRKELLTKWKLYFKA
jgi:putative chitinase